MPQLVCPEQAERHGLQQQRPQQGVLQRQHQPFSGSCRTAAGQQGYGSGTVIPQPPAADRPRQPRRHQPACLHYPPQHCLLREQRCRRSVLYPEQQCRCEKFQQPQEHAQHHHAPALPEQMPVGAERLGGKALVLTNLHDGSSLWKHCISAVLPYEFYYAYFSPDFHFYAKGRGFFG